MEHTFSDMSEKFKIVEATEEHKPYVVSVIMHRWNVTELEAIAEFYKWTDNPKAVCYVGLYDNKPIATGAVDPYLWRGNLYVSPCFTLLWVEPEYRGNDYGWLITQERFKWCAAKGHKIVYLDTIEAQDYHIKKGWTPAASITHDGMTYSVMQYLLDKTLSFARSSNIYDYAHILEPLARDFTPIFYQTMMTWCNVLPPDNANWLFWEVWLIKLGHMPVGVCGLYTLNGRTDTKELWLGWLGIIPELRNRGLGKQVMAHLYTVAKKIGCERMYSYVDKEGAPLSFYEREGFKVIGTVASYCAETSLAQIDGGDFEDKDDWVILKHLT